MLRIAVVEDDKTYAAQLKEYLVRYGTETNQKISVALFPDGEDIVTDYSAEFDIILMDVEMTFMDGMTAAEKIREKDNEVVIIFITNMPQYAIQGYKVDALDYVLKPISYFAFSQRIDRALTRVKKKEVTYITVAQKGGKKKLKSYFIDEKIQSEERDRIPLLADGSHILWIVGYRISAYYKVTKDTRRILEVRYDGGMKR